MIELTTLASAATNEEPSLVLHYSDGVRPCAHDDPDKAGELLVWMRALTGKDDRDLLNRSIQFTKRGRGKFTGAGDNAAARLQLSVSRIEAPGLAINGEPITKLTAEAYDVLPGWAIERMRKKLAELQGESEEIDEDDDEESGGVLGG